ncbi:hypothetical protein [Jannaschia sp. M317]|uniref:hypothetical protein n=1 Tax=Jannaschia sp. M317 TaxID=2867011 RepID=UPI0021A64A0C|nr:hypothetical protein [Jannaschia sp. M317]UWQ16122.1 hypothetical protein K3551_09215 [Jannaschia sp. M317]
MTLTRIPPVTLHVGAHRTANGSLHRLLDRDAALLEAAHLGVWTPRQTRTGLMSGLLGDPGMVDARRDQRVHRAAGRVAMRRGALTGDGVQRLVISDEALLGSLRENVLLGRLYPTISARMARLSRAVPGVDRVCLAIRSPDAWWGSVFAASMATGFAPPDQATLEAVLRARRGWRQVIEDLALALPKVRLTVWTHEEFGSRPDTIFQALTGRAPSRPGRPALNASPGLGALRDRLRDEGCTTRLTGVGDRYAPFTPDETAALQGAYADDLAWLRAGADGRATYLTQGSDDGPAHDRKGRIHGARH